MMKAWMSGGLALAVLCGAATAAERPMRSKLTALEPKTCKILKKHPDGNSYECPGLPGYPVYFAEGDHRTFLSFGPGANKRRAAEQTLGPFNTPFEKAQRRTTIEWRFIMRGEKAVPYAAIVRYFVTRDTRHGEALVVTRIGERDACHVAYIDAKANPEAIVMARRLADEAAPKFDCAKEPAIEGARGILAD